MVGKKDHAPSKVRVEELAIGDEQGSLKAVHAPIISRSPSPKRSVRAGSLHLA